MNEPKQIRAGDSIAWWEAFAEYLPVDGWALKYALRGPFEKDIVAYVVKDPDERVTLYDGMIEVLPDLTQVTGDIRSHVKKVLDALEAAIERKASKIQAEYEIEGHRIKYMETETLVTLRNKYRRMYQDERAAAGLGRPTSGVIKIGLG